MRRAAVIREAGPDPLQQRDDAVAEPDQEEDVRNAPERPGNEAVQVQPAELDDCASAPKRAVLVVDDTGLPKKGSASVGVAPQYCGQLGKQANCQVLVSLTLAQEEVPVPVGLRLFLPKTWAEDPDRCARAGVPEGARTAQGKPEMALAEIDRVCGRRVSRSAACWPMRATA
jgi:hypothetical protein